MSLIEAPIAVEAALPSFINAEKLRDIGRSALSSGERILLGSVTKNQFDTFVQNENSLHAMDAVYQNLGEHTVRVAEEEDGTISFFAVPFDKSKS